MSESLWRSAYRRIRQQRLTMAALGLLALFVATALFADCLASDLPIAMRYDGKLYLLPNVRHPGTLRRHDNHTLRQQGKRLSWAVYPLIPFGPNQTQPAGNLDVNVAPGTGDHLLGTDDVGRDVAAQLVHGARVALLVGVVSVLLYLLLGILLGALAGYLRGPVDQLVNWAVAVMLVIGLTGWATVARLVRGEVLRVLGLPFVEAARSLGASHTRILLRHVLPNSLGPVVVAATFGMASAILIESGLSFLGFGPNAPSWGRLLANAQVNRTAWWLTLFPGLAIFVTVLAYNFVAEGLQDALDPKHTVQLPRHWVSASRRRGD